MQRELETEVMDTFAEAAGYDAMDHTAPNRAFVDRLHELRARRARRQPDCKMLDLGAGPGHIPLLIAAEMEDAKIMAVDLSRHMLDIARSKLAATGFAERVAFELADVKALPFEEQAFDVVYSNTILHHIPQPLDMLREAWRVLRPEGILLIRDLYRPADEAALEDLVAMHTIGCDDHQRAMFRDSLKAALTPDELRTLAREAGMTDVELVIDTDRHMSLQR